jgi:Bacterial regulatory proteins, luxR family
VESHYALELVSDTPRGAGYLVKDRVGDVDELAETVRRVGRGGPVVDPAVVSGLVGRRRRTDPLDRLTEREREVLTLMAQGWSNAAIAAALFVRERPWRRTSAASSGSSTWPPPRTTTAGSGRCSPSSAGTPTRPTDPLYLPAGVRSGGPTG